MKGSIPPQYLQLRLRSLSIRILSTRVGLKITYNVGPASVSLRIFHLSNPFKSIQIIFKSIEIHLQRLRQFLVPTWVQPGQHRWENWSWGGDSRIWRFRKRYLEQQGFVAIVGPKTQIGSLDPSHPWCRQSTLARVDLAQCYLGVTLLCVTLAPDGPCDAVRESNVVLAWFVEVWACFVLPMVLQFFPLNVCDTMRTCYLHWCAEREWELSIVCQLNCTLGYIGHIWALCHLRSRKENI